MNNENYPNDQIIAYSKAKSGENFNCIDLSSICVMEIKNPVYYFKENGQVVNQIPINYHLYSDENHSRLLHSESIIYKESDFHEPRKKFIYPDWVSFETTLSAKAKKHLFKTVLRIAHSMPSSEKYELNPGYILYNNMLSYNTGDKLVFADKIKAYLSDSKFRLVDYEISSQCIEFADIVMADIPAVQNMFLASLVPYVSILVNASERSRCNPVIVILKNDETFATELSKVFFSMYIYKNNPNQPYNLIDVDSSQSAIEAKTQLNYCSVVLDSLRKTGENVLDRKIKHTVATLINRMHGVNNTELDSVNMSIKANLIVIADYFFDDPTMIRRCLFIIMNSGCKTKNLTWYKENVRYLMGLKVSFIQFIIRNYDELKREILTLLNQFSYKTASHKLSDYNAIMHATAEIFMKFYKEMKSRTQSIDISDVYDTSTELSIFRPEKSKSDRALFDSIDICITDNENMMKPTKNSWKYDIINKFLIELLLKNPKYVTNDLGLYIQELNNSDSSLPLHFVYCDNENKRFIMTSKHLELYFLKEYRKSFSKKSILKCLVMDCNKDKENCLIDTEGKNSTVHALSDCGINKRFISIKMKKAKKYIQDNLS